MRIDRETFSDYFTAYNIPIWNCSSCKKGTVVFNKKSFSIFETNESRKETKTDYWEPEMMVKYFFGKTNCNNAKCKEVFIIAGTITVEEDYDDEKGQIFTECYYPNFIFPVLHLFTLPDDIPVDVEEYIINAFRLFWIDKSACANAIRTSVETILNDKKVLKTELTKRKKRRSLSLHERIELFEKKNKEIANYLMAIKWIGNAGSHEGSLDTEDLLDGFDLLNHSIEKLYASHDKEIDQMTKKINKRRRPLK